MVNSLCNRGSNWIRVWWTERATFCETKRRTKRGDERPGCNQWAAQQLFIVARLPHRAEQTCLPNEDCSLKFDSDQTALNGRRRNDSLELSKSTYYQRVALEQPIVGL